MKPTNAEAKQGAGDESAFTPGPWKVITETLTADHRGMFFLMPQFGIQNDGKAICSGHGPDMIANAQLIASAPELLSALELLSRLEPECDDDDPALIAARHQARAAIAKATARA